MVEAKHKADAALIGCDILRKPLLFALGKKLKPCMDDIIEIKITNTLTKLFIYCIIIQFIFSSPIIVVTPMSFFHLNEQLLTFHQDLMFWYKISLFLLN